MACLRPLVIILVATMWFTTQIDAAAVHTLKFDTDRLQSLVSDDVTIANVEKIRAQRAIETTHTHEGEERTCHSTTPCGWAVYVPFTRRVDYYMKNTCTCPATWKCIRTDDDLSVSAYVYRCRQNASATDIESPNDSNTN